MVQPRDFRRTRRDLLELFGVGLLGSFDAAIELGRVGRQHEQPQPTLLAGGLEVGRELTAPIEVETRHAARRSSTTSVSVPQRGYGSRSRHTAWARTRLQVGWRTRRGRGERGESIVSSAWGL